MGYEFTGSWIFLFSFGPTPNITFSIENIDGSVIATYNTGDIKAIYFEQWQQFGFFFTNSNNSDIVLRLTNNGPGGCGNDLALDDITFRPCGPNVAAFVKGYNDSTDITVCQDNAADL